MNSPQMQESRASDAKAPQQRPIRSVLVAGLKTSENQFIRYCEELWLKAEHLEEASPTKVISTRHDAAIIVTTVASHFMYHRVRDLYSGKPIFIAGAGVSGIKEEFESKVFGGSHILAKLREIPAEHTRSAPAVPISIRLWWLLANFKSIGDTVKFKDVSKFFDRFLVKGQESALSGAWHGGRNSGFLEDVSRGVTIFNGIPLSAYEAMVQHKLPCPENVVMKMNNPAVVTPIKAPEKDDTVIQLAPVKETTEPAPKAAQVANDPASDLLLDSMTTLLDQQKQFIAMFSQTISEIKVEIKGIKEEINELREKVSGIPTTLERELRGVSVKTDSISAKLAGLGPDETAVVDQSIGLLLAMRKKA
jgi:hypothetical protein